MSSKVDIISLISTIQEGLGAYKFTPLVAQFINFMLKNRHEGLILVDPEAKIAFMDKYSEKYFGLRPGEAQNKPISDYISDSPVKKVIETGLPQIWQVKEAKGIKRIVSRYPISNNGYLIGAAVKVITHDMDEIVNLSQTVKRLQAKISKYKRDFLATNQARYTFDDILGISTYIRKTKELAMRLARTDSTILLMGESGTGKELFAHSIHQESTRADRPFVRVNCAAIPFSLAESELFGYVKGAFTGSNVAGQKGKFEFAEGGTIFLDEISSMPLTIQAMVLRVIQEREIQPLGSSSTKNVDFRLIAATNMDLEKLVRNGSFRGDLYYRLSAVPCHLSPLRKRPEDITFLARSLIGGINRKLNGNVRFINQPAIENLLNYDWPGNVRELINVLEQAVLNADQETEIGVHALPAFLRDMNNDKLSPKRGGIRAAVEKAERTAIMDALQRTNGNKRKASLLLGISRTALYQKLNRFNIIQDSKEKEGISGGKG